MEIQQLRHFVAVYDMGSFARAAESCNISQPAISTSIAQLEGRINAKLFDRGAFGARPTTYAERLYPSAKLIAAEVNRAKLDIAAMHNCDAGSVSVGIGPIFESLITPSLIARFVKRHPNINISIIEDITSDLYKRLSQGELDFTISTPPGWIEPPENIVVEILDDSHDVVVASEKHPIWEKKDFSLRTMASYPWIISAQVGNFRERLFPDIF